MVIINFETPKNYGLWTVTPYLGAGGVTYCRMRCSEMLVSTNKTTHVTIQIIPIYISTALESSYLLRYSSLRNCLHPLVPSALFDQNILLSIVFQNTLYLDWIVWNSVRNLCHWSTVKNLRHKVIRVDIKRKQLQMCFIFLLTISCVKVIHIYTRK
jgi:hypothetical protein